MEKGVHDGHRDRMRERYQQEGLEHFQPHEVLEFLLFHAIPRRNTSETGHLLLDQFGSLSAVLDAPVEALEQVPGMTHNAAVFLSLLSDTFRLYDRDKFQKAPTILDTTDKLRTLILSRLNHLPNEEVMLVCMDGKFKLLDHSILTTGSVNSSEITVRLILQRALLFNASIVVLAHNHPSGLAVPSKADITTTLQARRALQLADICLWDHIVVGEHNAISMRDTPALNYIFA